MRAAGLLAVALTMAIAACGSDGGDDTGSGRTASGGDVTPPAETCAAGEDLVVAAYDLETGDRRWAACSPGPAVRRSLAGATDEAVWVVVAGETGGSKLVAFDADDGSELADGGPVNDRPAVPDPLRGPPPGPVVDGVRLEGGQNGPTSAYDAASGRLLWSAPGRSVYSDVYAVGDGAVFVVDGSEGQVPPDVVAYELRSGKVRWKRDQLSTGNGHGLWPWLVDDEVLVEMWTNIALVSTSDSSIIWRTGYPNAEFPRMTDVEISGTSIFVVFSSVPSGGD